MTTLQMTQHILGLAKAYGVHLILDYRLPRDMAGAAVSARAVYARPITDSSGYAVVLHELGHICAPLGSLVRQLRLPPIDQTRDVNMVRRILRAQIDEEEAAWEWAQHNALEWTLDMEATKAFALGTYQQALVEFERLLKAAQGRK